MPNSTNETIFPLTIMMIVMVLMGAAGLYFFCQLETVSALFRLKRCQPIATHPSVYGWKHRLLQMLRRKPHGFPRTYIHRRHNEKENPHE